MSLRDDLTEVLQNANVQAMLRVIRNGETDQSDHAYRMLFGGGLVDLLTDHPRQKITRGGLTSTAAGAYQFLERTWDECADALGLLTFQPGAQDLAAVFLIRRRGALPDVLRGDLESAIAKCNKEWASLPGSPYGQPTRTMAQCREVWNRYGGSAQPADDGEAPTVREVLTVPTEKRMAPFPIIAALLPSLIEAIPKLGSLFAKSDNDKRNVAAAEAVFKVAKDALGAANEQEVVERVKADPVAAKAVSEAVESNWFVLSEAGGGGIEGARKADQAVTPAGKPWLSPSMWALIALLPLVYMIVGSIAGIWGYSDWSSDVRASLASAVVSLVVGGAAGFYWGSMTSKNRPAP